MTSRQTPASDSAKSPVQRRSTGTSFADWSQTALVWQHEVRDVIDYDKVVRASWDGAVAVAHRVPAEDAYLDSLVEHRVGPAWQLADELVLRLQGYGDFYVTLVYTGGKFRRRLPADEIVVMRRGPLLPGVDNAQLDSLGPEFIRSVGIPAPEPQG